MGKDAGNRAEERGGEIVQADTGMSLKEGASTGIPPTHTHTHRQMHPFDKQKAHNIKRQTGTLGGDTLTSQSW